MDTSHLTALDDIITRLRALRLTAKIAGLDGHLLGRLYDDDLPRLESLRALLADGLSEPQGRN